MKVIKIKPQELLCIECNIKWLYSKEIDKYGCPQCNGHIYEINQVKKAMTIWEMVMSQLKRDESLPAMIQTYQYGWVTEETFKAIYQPKRWNRLKEHWLSSQGAVYEDVDGNLWIDVTNKKKEIKS